VSEHGTAFLIFCFENKVIDFFLLAFQLSISEYRQRKQCNSSTELNSGWVEGDGGTKNPPACRGSRGRADSTSSSSSSVSSDDDALNAGASVEGKNLFLDSSPSLSALPLFLHTDTSDDKRGRGHFFCNV
jgi:hypothetical protein